MKQVFASQGQIDVLDVPEPTLRAAGEVLVATAFSVISSGTELDHLESTMGATETHPELRPSGLPKLRSASISWEMPADRSFPPNVALQGYSSAGTVLAIAPEITDLKVGDLVACGGLQSAFHAEIVAVPRNLVALVPAGVSLDDAAFATVGTIAMNPIRRSGCQFGETIVIYGLGLMGLMAVQIARSRRYVCSRDRHRQPTGGGCSRARCTCSAEPQRNRSRGRGARLHRRIWRGWCNPLRVHQIKRGRSTLPSTFVANGDV